MTGLPGGGPNLDVISLARCRAIGDSSQFLGTFRPGDPRLIFGLYGPGN
jgi:hypothetical protein